MFIISSVRLKHPFCATSRKSYLKMNALSSLTLLKISYMVQDAVQGFHWNNSLATLHPFAIYFKNDDALHSLSYCFMSILSYNANVAQAFIYYMLSTLKTLCHTLNTAITFVMEHSLNKKLLKTSQI